MTFLRLALKLYQHQKMHVLVFTTSILLLTFIVHRDFPLFFIPILIFLVQSASISSDQKMINKCSFSCHFKMSLRIWVKKLDKYSTIRRTNWLINWFILTLFFFDQAKMQYVKTFVYHDIKKSALFNRNGIQSSMLTWIFQQKRSILTI